MRKLAEFCLYPSTSDKIAYTIPMNKKPYLYLLDFDGVICDSAVETAVTGWRAAAHFWPDISGEMPSNILISQFRQVRPVLETGYEAILILRALASGITVDSLLSDFAGHMQQLLTQYNLSPDALKTQFASVRDHWIANDLDSWVDMNPLFDGIPDRLRALNQSEFPWYIITTKQERFVSQILTANNIPFPPEKIYGLDRKKSKIQVLAELQTEHPNIPFGFVEDRLPTLHNVIADPLLQSITLFLADWGYNTEQDFKSIKNTSIVPLSLDKFTKK